MSQQRFHDPDASLPSAGSARAIVPPFPRYYQGTATSCRPSRRASFPSLGGTTGTRRFRSLRRGVCRRRAWGWSPGIPVRVCFRGDGRISQVPGEPRFPFAHVLRPRPAVAPLTMTERSRGPRAGNVEGADHAVFRGSIAWLSGLLPTYHVTITRLTVQGSLPDAGQALLGGLGTRRAPLKGFQLTSCSLSSFPKLLGTIPRTPEGFNA
jgi:hypothetical protein